MGNGVRGGIPAASVAATVVAAALGAWLGSTAEDSEPAPRSVTAAFSAGGGYVSGPPSADTSGGMWVAIAIPGVPAPDSRGALVHINADGRTTKFPMPTPDSLPAFPAAATDGSVWFDYAQGDGWPQTVDTGLALSHPADSIARLGTDGKIERFPVVPADHQFSIWSITAGSDSTAWFIAADVAPGTNVAAHVFGRIWPDGHSTVHPMPDELKQPLALLPNRDGTVWIGSFEDRQEVLRMNPDTGKVSARYLIPDMTQYEWLAGPIAGRASEVWVESGDFDMVAVDADGAVVSRAALGGRTQPAATAADGRGGFWMLESRPPDQPYGQTVTPELTHIHHDGTAKRYASPVPLPTRGPSAYRAWSLAVGSDGVVWLAAGPKVYRLG